MLGRQDPKLPFQTPEGELRSHNDGFSGTSRVHKPDLKQAEAPLFIIIEYVTSEQMNDMDLKWKSAHDHQSLGEPST